MNPMPSLEPMLKQLRLSGVLDSLELRNRQAIESKLAYTDFLALLIQDEVARRSRKLRASAGGQVHVVGVASASTAAVHGREPLARYNLIRIDPGRLAAPIEIETRGFAAPDGQVISLGRRALTRGSPAPNE